MTWKEFFKPSLNKIGIFIFLILFNLLNIMFSCIGGICWPDLNFLIEIVVFYLFSCIIIFLINRFGKKKQLLKYIFTIIFFWMSVLLMRSILSVVKYPNQLLDIDLYEEAFGFATVSTVYLLPILLLAGIINWIIKKFKK
ncbi:MAG: hypothetical protein AABX73_00170 [Nanoarchaeota archaeon]